MERVALALVAVYALALLALSRGAGGTGAQFLLAGRRLTLPAFVATLVTTWYGGILGVGEYGWRYGVSTWLVFGVPYYLAAVLFSLALARRLRRSQAMSIPDLLASAYGRGAALAGGTAVLAMTVPAAYVLALAILIGQVTGLPLAPAALLAASFSALYVGLSGFRAVVRTDLLQMVLMYGGFLMLLPAALHHTGGLSGLIESAPASHLQWHGGLGWQAVAVWYLIALQTMVEPAFYQRVFAARSSAVARSGILVSVLLWAVFDFLTTFSAIAARVLLPDLSQPVAAFPELARAVLPTLPAALVMVALFATVMSTLDSYLFLAAATIGHDLVRRPLTGTAERRRTRLGLAAAALLATAGALAFRSVVQIWHDVGTVVTSALLLPVLAVNLSPARRFSAHGAPAAMVVAAVTAVVWLALRTDGRYPLGVEPMFPALAASALCWALDLALRRPHGSCVVTHDRP